MPMYSWDTSTSPNLLKYVYVNFFASTYLHKCIFFIADALQYEISFKNDFTPLWTAIVLIAFFVSLFTTLWNIIAVVREYVLLLHLLLLWWWNRTVQTAKRSHKAIKWRLFLYSFFPLYYIQSLSYSICSTNQPFE